MISQSKIKLEANFVGVGTLSDHGPPHYDTVLV